MKLPASRWIPQLSANTWLRILAGIAVTAAFLIHEGELVTYRFVQQMELWAYDTRLRLFMPNTVDPRIVILDIDEKSLNAEGRWPWSRNKLAFMVKQLFDKYQIKVVGFDVAFPEPDPSSGLANLEDMAKTDLKDDAAFQSKFSLPAARLPRLRPGLRRRDRRSTPSCSASSSAASRRNPASCLRRCSVTEGDDRQGGTSRSATSRRGDTAATCRSCRRTPRRRATSTRSSIAMA